MAWHIGQSLHHAYPVCAVVAVDYLPWQVTGTSGNEPNGEGALATVTRTLPTSSKVLFKRAARSARRARRARLRAMLRIPTTAAAITTATWLTRLQCTQHEPQPHL